MANRQTAQRRVDRIRAFREELAEVERDQVLTVSVEDRARLSAYHDRLVSEFSKAFDVDVAAGQRQLSIGMRIASAFGAAALGVSVFLFFYNIWADLTTTSQIAILTISPLVGLAAMGVAARRERTLYITGVLGVLTVATFVLDLYALGEIFNVVPSANAFLAWTAFAVVLAYGLRLRWLLGIGLISFTVWVSASLVVWSGGPGLSSAFDRFETYLLAGTVILLVGSRVSKDDFAPTWRATGWFVVFSSLLVLSLERESVLPIDRDTARFMYQFGGMAVTAGAIAVGVRRGWSELVNLGSLFFAAFLITRLVDWFWSWMPNYGFFLMIGLLALGLISVFRRLRGSMEARA